MADTLDIVSFAAVADVLSVPADKEPLLAGYITAASRHIDDLCGPVVKRTITDETHHGGNCTVALKKYPVISITSITENGTTVDPTGYHLDGDTGLVERITASSYYPYSWQVGRWNVVVTYVAGRHNDTASVDPVFAEAAKMAVRGLWTSQQAIQGTTAFGAYGGDLEVNGAPDITQFVLPRAAYMLLKGGNYIQSRVLVR